MTLQLALYWFVFAWIITLPVAALLWAVYHRRKSRFVLWLAVLISGVTAASGGGFLLAKLTPGLFAAG